MKLLKLNYLLGWALVLATLYFVAFKVPLSEKLLGQSYLIFFFHYPSAITCLLFFLISGVASALYLIESSPAKDRAALAAAEIGILGCTITLVTGSIWAKAAWGYFWVWEDKRLLTVAIMWFVYLGYIALRWSVESPVQKARFAAVFGVIAALTVPLVWYSIRIWGERRHPMAVEFDPEMKFTMRFGAVAFLCLYLAMMSTRMRVARLGEESRRIEELLAQRDA